MINDALQRRMIHISWQAKYFVWTDCRLKTEQKQRASSKQSISDGPYVFSKNQLLTHLPEWHQCQHSGWSPYGPANPTLVSASQDCKAALGALQRIWPRVQARFAPHSPVLCKLGTCRGWEQGSTVTGLLSCPNFKELVCHHTNTLSYPRQPHRNALLTEDKRTHLGNTLEQRLRRVASRSKQQQPRKGIQYMSTECNSISACLIEPKGNKSMPVITLTQGQTQAHCHSSHNHLMMSSCPTTA